MALYQTLHKMELLFLWSATAQTLAYSPPPLLKCLDHKHTQTHTPLKEWAARLRGRYTAQNKHNINPLIGIRTHYLGNQEASAPLLKLQGHEDHGAYCSSDCGLRPTYSDRHVEANVRHLESIDTYDTVDSESTEVLCLNFKNERYSFLLYQVLENISCVFAVFLSSI